LLDSQSDRHVVQIFNREQTRIIDTVLAVPAERLEPRGHTQFTFWETPPGTAKAMRMWYYPGDNMGQEFPYPTHLQQIALMRPEPAPAPAAATPAPEPQAGAELAPQQETPAQSQPVNPESAPQEPTTIAQNSTPQDSTPPAPVDTNPAPDQTRQLPKTGSPYPLIGLSGTLLLGLYGLLRLKRFA
jgi:LPXTG-motif cell wall-anchored protein